MKMSPQMVKAQANMQPGVITATGFLGDESAPLVDLIARDEDTMHELGLDFDDVADRLEWLLEEGRKGLGEPVTIEGTWLVKTDEARGHLPSPFEDGIFRKVNATIRRTDGSTAEVRVSHLSLHLMRKYHFLEGKGSPFRIEPSALKSVLGL